jgi:hypothetical protein
MEVDYTVYADGEALLGWLNCTVQLAATEAFDANKFLKELASEIQTRLRMDHAEVAHLKMTLNPEGGLGELGVVNVVRNDYMPELSMELEEPVERGQLIINLRAEAAPASLDRAVRQSLTAAARAFRSLTVELEDLEHFRPGKPTPTHRVQRITGE